ncbi:MAG: hypothetical protein MZV70_21800 [Desulfobacterales bacterium]|nr:hypothetical protein [Desulfobacterales bacterium]
MCQASLSRIHPPSNRNVNIVPKTSSGNIRSMKMMLFSLILAFLLAVSVTEITGARAQTAEPESGAVVCAPGIRPETADNCIIAGPSAYLNELEDLGLTFPQRPLHTKRPDPALTILPYRYFRLDEEEVPQLTGPGGGTERAGLTAPGFVYVSYLQDRVDTGKGIYYMLESGAWIAGQGARFRDLSHSGA